MGPSPRKSGSSQPTVPTQPNRSSGGGGSNSFMPIQRPRPSTVGSISKNSAASVFAGLLPASVSLEPITKGQSAKTLPVNRKRPAVSVSINRAAEPVNFPGFLWAGFSNQGSDQISRDLCKNLRILKSGICMVKSRVGCLMFWQFSI